MVIDKNNNPDMLMKDKKQNRKKKRKRTSRDGDNNEAPNDIATSMLQTDDGGTGMNSAIVRQALLAATKTIHPASGSNTIAGNDSKHSVKQNDSPVDVPKLTFHTNTIPKRNNHPNRQYITTHDGHLFHELLQNAYSRFSYVPASQVDALVTMESSASVFDQHPHPKQIHHYPNNDFHLHYQNVLRSLHDYYQYDIIMPGGKHSSRTFVRRTLVGEPGMTYKYLGLRLFTHAWRNNITGDKDVNASKKNSKTVSSLFHNVYMLNQAMIQMTEHQLRIYQERTGKVVPKHLYDYNLTLINYMEPCNDVNGHNSTNTNSSRVQHQQLRDEEFYNMGKASVSWHADSSLQDNSCIGVYHTLFHNSTTDDRPSTKTSRTKISSAMKGHYHGYDNDSIGTEDNNWKIALRPNPTTTLSTSNTSAKKARFGGKTNTSNNNVSTTQAPPPPPIVVPTKSGDVYFLLDKFNHKYQHMVLAGSNHQYRISSTHRVAVTETDTYQYISQACSTALLSSKAEMKKPPNNIHHWDTSILLHTQTVLNEVEFEWIAQYWIQGNQHDIQHVWWQKPIRALEEAWNALERVTYKIYTNIIASSVFAVDNNNNNNNGDSALPPRDLVQGLLSAFQTRQELRLKWDHRRSDKIYKRRISIHYQPVERPLFPSVNNKNNTNVSRRDDSTRQPKQLPKDLTDAIQTLSDLLQTYPQKKIK